jgi:hypothetical protein
MKWTPISEPPRARTYMVGNADFHQVGQARYMPRSKTWKFPAAKMAFGVTHWQDMPEPPSECGGS